MNREAVYRTAPAKPGLLIIMLQKYLQKYSIEPLESFIFRISEESGHQDIFPAYQQETKKLSVRDKKVVCKRQKKL